MKRLSNTLLLFAILLLVWLALTDFNLADRLLPGAVFSLVVAAIFAPGLDILSEIRPSWRGIGYGLVYPIVFLRELVLANLDVASRVVRPRIPISPGIVKVKTSLRSRLGRIILANSITLTPGTLTVETEGEFFYIHWIDVTSPDIEEASREIVRTFEKYLEVMFG
ncbi:Na+/H+ antiporter subunit E [bacterium]|nr:Na+/H+ antiporter subunit E [bacterium]